MGATIGGAFGALAGSWLSLPNITIPAFAMIGMAAMVGGGTGAAMTAIVMISEMTRNYSIVMPMIIAVAVSIGIRRVLSEENIYTIKLAGRKHFIPKAMHANMFLIRQAREVMEKDFQLLPRSMGFDEFLRMPERAGTFRHIVVTDGERIAGTLRVNISLRHGLEGAYTGVDLGSVASETFTIAHEDDIMFEVIHRFWRKGASMIVVVRGEGVPRASDVVGVITKEHIADSVAESVRPYVASNTSD
jgi:CIC family chloride channel protein